MKNRLALLFFLFSLNSFAKTYVIVDNRTSHTFSIKSLQSGYELSSKKWKQLRSEISPNSKKSILVFNRDSGIKNGKDFLFSTNLSPKINECSDKSKCEIKLYQSLRGKLINSRMWTSLGLKTDTYFKWYRDRKWRYKTLVLKNELIKISYRAYPDKTDDNVIYKLESYKRPGLDDNKENEINIINYNVQFRPMILFPNDGQIERAKMMPEYLGGSDVVIITEALDDDARGLLVRGLKREYPYSSKVVGRDRGFEQDGGVQVVSKYPVLAEDEDLFKGLCHKLLEDCLADKGVGYTHILKGNQHYHFFTSHLQAGYTEKDIQVRGLQLLRMKRLMLSKKIPKDHVVIFAGDLNVPLQDRDFEDSSLGPLKTFLHSLIYGELAAVNNVFDFLKAALGVSHPNIIGHPYSFDPPINEMANQKEPSEFVDHVLVSKFHKKPVSEVVEAQLVKTKIPWKGKKGKKMWELSDHFPVKAHFKF